MAVTGINPAAAVQSLAGVGSKTNDTGSSFKDMLSNAIQGVDDANTVAQNDTSALLSGQVDDVAQVMIDQQKANLQLDLVVQVRNKVVDAYSQIMNMQV
jgi:flagellar hook-basal body complex protein FliE